MDASTEKLVAALEAKRDYRLKPMIEKAKEGYYHDYKTQLLDPIGHLVRDLRAWGHEGLAQQAINGAFDATREEADAWLNSLDGKAVLAEFPHGMRKIFERT
jgi:hypothetical protein